jgi:hypothetical protein
MEAMKQTTSSNNKRRRLNNSDDAQGSLIVSTTAPAPLTMDVMPELVALILSHVDPLALPLCRAVSRQWHGALGLYHVPAPITIGRNGNPLPPTTNQTPGPTSPNTNGDIPWPCASILCCRRLPHSPPQHGDDDDSPC